MQQQAIQNDRTALNVDIILHVDCLAECLHEFHSLDLDYPQDEGELMYLVKHEILTDDPSCTSLMLDLLGYAGPPEEDNGQSYTRKGQFIGKPDNSSIEQRLNTMGGIVSKLAININDELNDAYPGWGIHNTIGKMYILSDYQHVFVGVIPQ